MSEAQTTITVKLSCPTTFELQNKLLLTLKRKNSIAKRYIFFCLEPNTLSVNFTVNYNKKFGGGGACYKEFKRCSVVVLIPEVCSSYPVNSYFGAICSANSVYPMTVKSRSLNCSVKNYIGCCQLRFCYLTLLRYFRLFYTVNSKKLLVLEANCATTTAQRLKYF